MWERREFRLLLHKSFSVGWSTDFFPKNLGNFSHPQCCYCCCVHCPRCKLKKSTAVIVWCYQQQHWCSNWMEFSLKLVILMKETSNLFYLNSTSMSRSPPEDEPSWTMCIQIFCYSYKALPSPKLWEIISNASGPVNKPGQVLKMCQSVGWCFYWHFQHLTLTWDCFLKKAIIVLYLKRLLCLV